jgi:hypothetical protein
MSVRVPFRAPHNHFTPEEDARLRELVAMHENQ